MGPRLKRLRDLHGSLECLQVAVWDKRESALAHVACDAVKKWMMELERGQT